MILSYTFPWFVFIETEPPTVILAAVTSPRTISFPRGRALSSPHHEIGETNIAPRVQRLAVNVTSRYPPSDLIEMTTSQLSWWETR